MHNNDDKESPPGSSTDANNRRGPWSPEEDRQLLELVSVFGPSNWVRISNSLATRTPKQCRERYHQNLKPSLNRSPITAEEGALIESLVAKHGKKWAEIARHLNGRSDNAVKNWWNGGASRRRRQSTQEGQTFLVGQENHNQEPNQNHPNQNQNQNQPPFHQNQFQNQVQNQVQNVQPMLHLPQPHISQPHISQPHIAQQPLQPLQPLLHLPASFGAPKSQSSTHPSPSPYPLPNVPHIAFNTQMFGPHSNYPRDYIGHQDPFARPPNFRLASFDQENFKTAFPPPTIHPSKRRLLDDNPRRHSTTGAPADSSSQGPPSTSPSGTILPYHSPLLLSHTSRNNSVSHELYLNSSGSALMTVSRRSSIAPDWFPNPIKDDKAHKRNASQNSYSPSLTPVSRFSVSSAVSNATSPNVASAPAPASAPAQAPAGVPTTTSPSRKDKTRLSVSSLIE